MRCPACRHESPAQAKFCRECGDRLVLPCSNCGTELPPSAKFCLECGQRVAPSAGATVSSASPEAYTPRHLAERILTTKAALEGERKQVTVLFADLKVSMELLADRDPEAARKILTDVLFRDLWLRPDLAPRDRSLMTVSALIASGHVGQIPYHLNRAMDAGLTQAQAAEVIYAGWPNAFSALPVAKDVFEKRPK